MWPFRRAKPQPAEDDSVINLPRSSWFASDSVPFDPAEQSAQLQERLDNLHAMMPTVVTNGTTDSCDDEALTDAALLEQNSQGVSEALFLWYATQGFIGHQMCAVLSQNWLINKACTMPARDAIRQGFTIQRTDGESIPEEAMRIFKRYDKRFRLTSNLVQQVRLGRVFGIRIAFCKITSDDPEFYEKPFNADGITAGSYKGIVQVDPYWCAPVLDAADTADPTAIHFYEPTYWLINGQKFHRSHLCVFKTMELPDVLKPAYYYGGVPVPQLIMERVYASERTANEAPAMALSKRTTVLKTDAGKALANESKFIQKMQTWMTLWSNFGVKVIDKTDDEVEQFDTALADFDALIMTQYQLVAAASEVPATKLLGTTPKGFNSTGEYDESSYHEMLESIQTHDMTPLAERHHLCVMRSYVVPVMRRKDADFKPFETEVDWNPLDSPTLKEYAEIEEIQARTAAAYQGTGAMDGYDIRDTVINNPNSMFKSLARVEPPESQGNPDAPENDYRRDIVSDAIQSSQTDSSDNSAVSTQEGF